MAGFRSLEPYSRPRTVDWFVPLAMQVPALRRRLAQLPQRSRLRRDGIFRVVIWAYRRFNETREIPEVIFTDGVVLNQTAALLGTAGRFEGRERVQEIISELHETFHELRFEPERAIEVSKDRLLLAVRFSAIGAGSDLPMQTVLAHIWTIDLDRGGVCGLDVYWELREALEALDLRV